MTAHVIPTPPVIPTGPAHPALVSHTASRPPTQLPNRSPGLPPTQLPTLPPGLPPARLGGDPASRHPLARLQREWGRLARSPRAVAIVRGWQLHIAPFDSLDEVLVAAGLGVVGRPADADDELLGRLVLLARDQPLAGRILLQRLLPGLSAIARRRHPDERAAVVIEAIDDLLAASWTVITTYPIERRQRWVVASLLRESERSVYRGDRRRRVETVLVGDELDELADADGLHGDPDPADELAELLAEACRRGLDPADVELARRLAAGATPAELAAEHDVTDRTIRNHRAALVHRLRAVALASG